MKLQKPQATFTVNVFTRHSSDCLHVDNPQYRKCGCRKSVSIYDAGRVTYRSAGTRTWKGAETFAQLLRDERDPVKSELARIAAVEADKVAVANAKRDGRITVSDALDQWIAAKKGKADSSMRVYRNFVRKMKSWSAHEGITVLADVTPTHLDRWRSQWGTNAERKDDQIAATTQSIFQSRLKGFFLWAKNLRLIQDNPATHLAPISSSDEETMPLTRHQFEQLLAATAKHDEAGRCKTHDPANELKTLFIIMRWTGLRISDVLQMRRDAIRDHVITLKTLKTNADYEGTVPDLVLDAIARHLPPRHGIHPDYLFWSRNARGGKLPNGETLLAKWLKIIQNLNRHLDFKDEEGRPMRFRSHMLRDTFAVELLLADVPIERVSRLLTHSDIATTERYYARWVKARRQKLQDELVSAMRRMGVEVSV